jgi:hypothetical protein
VEVSHCRFYRYGSESDDSDISICSSDRKRIEEENNFRAQIKPNNNNFHPPRPNNYERRPFSPHNQVSQIENDNTSTAESDFPQ